MTSQKRLKCSLAAKRNLAGSWAVRAALLKLGQSGSTGKSCALERGADESSCRLLKGTSKTESRRQRSFWCHRLQSELGFLYCKPPAALGGMMTRRGPNSQSYLQTWWFILASHVTSRHVSCIWLHINVHLFWSTHLLIRHLNQKHRKKIQRSSKGGFNLPGWTTLMSRKNCTIIEILSVAQLLL